jgi:hypothetical protein
MTVGIADDLVAESQVSLFMPVDGTILAAGFLYTPSKEMV